MVTTLHGTDITLVGSHPTYKSSVEFSINNSDVVTAVSKSLKEDTLRLFNITNDIKVVYNFIDTEKYDRAEETECNRITIAKPEERIITHVSNFRPVKRTQDVIKIFNEVLKEVPSKLLMVGDGPEWMSAELLVSELGIEESVIFLGNSNEVVKILCYTDV